MVNASDDRTLSALLAQNPEKEPSPRVRALTDDYVLLGACASTGVIGLGSIGIAVTREHEKDVRQVYHGHRNEHIGEYYTAFALLTAVGIGVLVATVVRYLNIYNGKTNPL